MANKYWGVIAPNSAVWDTGPWVDAAGAGTTAPGANDDAIFDGRFNGHVLPSTATVNPERAVFSDKYTGNVADSGGRLLVSPSISTSVKSRGDVYLGGTHVTLTARKEGRSVFDFGGTVSGDTYLTRGVIVLPSGASLAALYVGYVSSLAGDVVLDIQSGVTLTSAEIKGGAITTRSRFTRLGVVRSNMTILEGDWSTSEINVAGAGTVLNVLGRATYGTINVKDGLVDFSGDAQEKTITTARVWSEATLNIRNGSQNITITTPVIIGRGNIITEGSVPPGTIQV